MERVAQVFPGRITTVLTDNGSEFRDAFDQWLSERDIQHCWTYPRCLDMNPFNERFNRTLQEEWVSYTGRDPVNEIRSFNHDLIDYSGVVQHSQTTLRTVVRTPMQVLSTHLPDLSNMSWPQTQEWCELA